MGSDTFTFTRIGTIHTPFREPAGTPIQPVFGAGVEGVPITTIYKGILPFLAGDFIRLALVVLFPGIALFLPRLMG